MAQRVKDLALPQFKGGSYSSESIPDAGTYSMPQLWPKKKKKKLLKKSKVKKMINKTFIKSFFFFFFFATPQHAKFLRQGSNPHHSSDLSHCTGNTGSTQQTQGIPTRS